MSSCLLNDTQRSYSFLSVSLPVVVSAWPRLAPSRFDGSIIHNYSGIVDGDRSHQPAKNSLLEYWAPWMVPVSDDPEQPIARRLFSARL